MLNAYSYRLLRNFQFFNEEGWPGEFPSNSFYLFFVALLLVQELLFVDTNELVGTNGKTLLEINLELSMCDLLMFFQSLSTLTLGMNKN